MKKRKMRKENQMWLKFGRLCAEGKRDLWDRKKRRVRLGRDRARESFCCIKIPKGTVIAPGTNGSKL